MRVILRSDIAGVFYAKLLKSKDPSVYLLAEARKVWTFEGCQHCEGLALIGPDSRSSQISGPVKCAVRRADGDQIIYGVTEVAQRRFDACQPWN